MAVSQQIYGLLLVVLPPIFALFYLRFTFVFLRHKKYRKQECYRIMIQIGLLECSTAPAFVADGLVQLIGNDFNHIAAAFLVWLMVASKVDGFLNMLLAMNRLKILCDLRYPDCMHTVVIAIAWLYGGAFMIYYLVPSYGFHLEPGYFIPIFDESRRFYPVASVLGGAVYEASLCVTLAIYIIVVGYLLWKTRGNTAARLNQDRSILTYALIKFVVNMLSSIAFHYAPLSTPLLSFIIAFVYVFKLLFLPPVLYLALFRTARNDFFNRKTALVFPTQVSPNRTMQLERSV